ncbi:hypothetical protein ACLOJK_013290 [Asimina triloba]
MTHKRINVTTTEIDSLHQKYHISTEFELIPADPHDNPRDPMPKCLCVNKHMLRVAVWLPFEFDIAEALIAFSLAPIQLIAPNDEIENVTIAETKL